MTIIHKTSIKKIYTQKNHALRIVYTKDRCYHTKERSIFCKVLNVYKLNLLNTSIFKHRTKTGADPEV